MAQRSWSDATDDIVEIKSGKGGVRRAEDSGGPDKNGVPDPKKNSAGAHTEKALGMSALVVGAPV